MRDPKPKVRNVGGAGEEMTTRREIDDALTAEAGQIYTVPGEESSLVIGRGKPLPIDDDAVNEEEEYPKAPKSKGDYDTWLG